jgi:hypothetical protein
MTLRPVTSRVTQLFPLHDERPLLDLTYGEDPARAERDDDMCAVIDLFAPRRRKAHNHNAAPAGCTPPDAA